MTKQDLIADQIFNELDRLGVSTNQEVYSGLMADTQSLLVEGFPDVVVVKIYDDQADGLYDGERVLSSLRSIEKATLEPDSANNVWNLIREFEI